MLKFVKHHMESIFGIEVFPLISFVMFFLFFLAVTWYVYGRDKSFFTRIGNLPLEGNDSSDNTEIIQS